VALGSALIGESLPEVETHLSEAITRCRRINLVELEPEILLAWARWHRGSGNPAQARKDAEEALAIADRCGYRLVQADVQTSSRSSISMPTTSKPPATTPKSRKKAPGATGLHTATNPPSMKQKDFCA
jgi:hypothetical protein